MARISDDCFIGYLSYFLSAKKEYYGGLLVTNSRGVPKEFRHSTGVKPSKIQTALYGDSLESSLGTDALAPALYESLTIKPDILLINKAGRDLFGRFAVSYPPAALVVSYPDPDMAFADFISPDSNLTQPTAFDLKGNSAERIYVYLEDDLSSKKGINALELAQKRMNLLSPFERVNTVLAEIALVEQGRTR